MPNHIENIITLKGDEQKIREMLTAIQGDDYGIGSVDFNKIIPMPQSLNIEAGSNTDRGLKLYKEFISEYLFAKRGACIPKITSKDLEKSEKDYLQSRRGIKADEWELGKVAWNNIQKYGAPLGMNGVSIIGAQTEIPTAMTRIYVTEKKIIYALRQLGVRRIR